MKQKKCRICKQPYIPVRPMQSTCNEFSCMVEYADKAAAKSKQRRAIAEKREVAEKRIQLKTAMDWTKDAQTAFNAFIRERDKDKPCICCGLPLISGEVGGKFDCGHYRSVGSAPHLRFDERNAHGQRKQCNRWGAGRAVDYRIGLISRLGVDIVEAIEADQSPKKYTIDQLKQIVTTYRAKLKELKNG